MKFRKKPVVIDAFQLNGREFPVWFSERIGKDVFASGSKKARIYRLVTLEGEMIASRNDYIIKGLKGEIYPCKPDIFEQSYEAVDE